MQIKIITYNILNGFYENPFIQNPKLEIKRLALAKKIIFEENPDILVLTEAFFGDKNKKPYNDYMNFFDFKYGFYSPSFSGCGNFLLSKFPIKGKMIKLTDRTALRAEITIGSKKIFVDIIHPSPSIRDEEKYNSIKPLLETHKKPYILTGDFNSLSDEDKYDEKVLLHDLKNVSEEPNKIVEILLERKLIPNIKKFNLKDAFFIGDRSWTLPTLKYKNKSQGGSRLDYFFISDKIKVIKTKILKNKNTELASDHYPIMMIFEI